LTLVEGLLKAIVDIDKVVKIVRGSEDASEAKSSLMKTFKLSDEQATHILDMPLRRLTKMSKIELDTEQKSLKSEISALTALLKSEAALRAKVSEELGEVAKKFATPRRTVIA
jgi:DNA gyrase/topoisomerase IV subunit A